MTKAEVIAELSQRAADLFEVNASELVAQSRMRGPVLARRWVWLQLRDEHGWSYLEIGKAMQRGPSTVVHGVQRAREEQQASRGQVGLLRESLEQWEWRMGWSLEEAT